MNTTRQKIEVFTFPKVKARLSIKYWVKLFDVANSLAMSREEVIFKFGALSLEPEKLPGMSNERFELIPLIEIYSRIPEFVPYGWARMIMIAVDRGYSFTYLFRRPIAEFTGLGADWLSMTPIKGTISDHWIVAGEPKVREYDFDHIFEDLLFEGVDWNEVD